MSGGPAASTDEASRATADDADDDIDRSGEPHESSMSRLRARLDRFLEPVTFQVFAADAWSDPREIDIGPLARVKVEFDPVAPDYVEAATARIDGSARQLSVVEGSSVGISLVAENKRLNRATIRVREKLWEFRPRDATARRRWDLDLTGTPFESLGETLRYTIEVTDEDELALENPIQGVLRVRPDRPPRISAAVVTQHVLPTAKPRVSYGAVDDHGISRVNIAYEIQRAGGQIEKKRAPVFRKRPRERAARILRDEVELDLASLALVKGDRVLVVLHAVDWRGKNKGERARSDGLTLMVTDERGVLAAMVESDHRSAKQLDAIIERQLGIGRAAGRGGAARTGRGGRDER